jgi:single stranded DNA-binding protein
MTTQDSANTNDNSYTLNSIVVSGNVAATPEFAYTKNGKAVCKTVIYSTRRWEDKATKEKHEITTKFKLVAWGELAERMHNAVGKGDLIEVEGQVAAPEAWLSKKEVNEDGTPKLESINVVNIFEGRVVFSKRTESPAPTNNNLPADPAEPVSEDFGDIPF